MKKRILTFVCLLVAIPCQARIITIDNDGPADFNNIQAAINDANNGDTIIVADGTYIGNGNRDIDFLSKSITVRSANGPTNCIVDCQGSPVDEHCGFYYIGCDSPSCILDGFTITGAMTTTDWQAGGAYCGRNAIIRNCIFQGNYSYYRGGAINAGGFCSPPCNPSAEITNCTFVNNVSEKSGGAVSTSGYFKVILRNCISWANSTPDFNYVIRTKSDYPRTYVEFSILQSDWYNLLTTLENCMVADPCFADPCNGDYHLKSQAGRWDPTSQAWVQDDVTSVAIDAGNPADPVGAEPFPNGGFINMGAYGGTSEASKSYFGGPVCQTIVAGDINGDCTVDFKDFAIMALHWLNSNQ